MTTTTISRPAAEAVASEVLKAVGVPEVHAAMTAQSLVLADLRGVTTHGLVRLPVYVEQIRSGDIVSTASPGGYTSGRGDSSCRWAPWPWSSQRRVRNEVGY